MIFFLQIRLWGPKKINQQPLAKHGDCDNVLTFLIEVGGLKNSQKGHQHQHYSTMLC